jgi:hypothetical protein
VLDESEHFKGLLKEFVVPLARDRIPVTIGLPASLSGPPMDIAFVSEQEIGPDRSAKKFEALDGMVEGTAGINGPQTVRPDVLFESSGKLPRAMPS